MCEASVWLALRSFCFVVALGSMAAIPCAAESRVKLSTGVDYSSGRYGADEDIEDIYIPVTASVNSGRLGFRLTLPYLYVSAPTGTVISDVGGQPLTIGSGDTKTVSGMGDVIASATRYDVFNSPALGLVMDITAKIKFGTADESKGLGTGENDYSLQSDFYKFAGRVTVLGSIGYKLRGDPEDIDLKDVWFASTGGIYRFNRELRGGIVYTYRESAIVDRDAIQELASFVSLRLNDAWRVQVHGLVGFSNRSPDWGTGVMIKLTF